MLVNHVEDPVDSHPTQSHERTTDQSESSDNLLITLRKSSRSTHNPHTIYNFLHFHCLSSSYAAFISDLSFGIISKNVREVVAHSGWKSQLTRCKLWSKVYVRFDLSPTENKIVCCCGEIYIE